MKHWKEIEERIEELHKTYMSESNLQVADSVATLNACIGYEEEDIVKYMKAIELLLSSGLVPKGALTRLINIYQELAWVISDNAEQQ